MSLEEWEEDFYGDSVSITTKEDDCTIYRITNADGEAVLTRYQLYPGIALVFNDVHTERISIGKKMEYPNILEINHCREGRIEFESAIGEFLYIKKGDMAINTKAGVKEYSVFPQAHYHGVSIELDLDVLQVDEVEAMKDLDLHPDLLKILFCGNEKCFVLHEKQEFEHVFEELYSVPDIIRTRYYKMKVLEILLFLSAINPEQERIENRYFNKDTVARVKEVHKFMISHLDEELTIDALSEKYTISPTNLKKCFKEVYGKSVYAYWKEYRIHEAANLLRNKDYSIAQIAGMVGYDNASKFSSSFKSIMGINPKDYRKSCLNGAF